MLATVDRVGRDAGPGASPRLLPVRPRGSLLPMSNQILLGTRKGTLILDRKAGRWTPRAIAHAGVSISYAARDPRDGTLWVAMDHAHWGPKLSRSKDDGKTWENLTQIAYPEGRALRRAAPADARSGSRRRAADDVQGGGAAQGVGARVRRRRSAGDDPRRHAARRPLHQRRRRRPLGAQPRAVEPREPRRRSLRRRRDQPQPVGRHAGGDRVRRVRAGHPLDRRRPARLGSTSSSACRRRASWRRATAARRGPAATAACSTTTCPTPRPSGATIRTS